jgi:hypothetical protein
MGTMTVDPAPPRPSALRFEDRDGRTWVTDAPQWAEFHTEWLYQAAQHRKVTIFGLDVVVHADNGDFHYRHEADLPNGAVLMRRVDG